MFAGMISQKNLAKMICYCTSPSTSILMMSLATMPRVYKLEKVSLCWLMMLFAVKLPNSTETDTWKFLSSELSSLVTPSPPSPSPCSSRLHLVRIGYQNILNKYLTYLNTLMSFYHKHYLYCELFGSIFQGYSCKQRRL